ncbi:hypothetical protein Btru_059103 [Bulinus truncatus]|nr:hypothetical protein Btru_059103 [Bulinus truncatus]
MQGNTRPQPMNLTLEPSNSSDDFDQLHFSQQLSPGSGAATEHPVHSRRHRVSCGSLTTSSSSASETSGTKIIRSCSSSFSHASEYQKPVGRYYHLHQQQQQQQLQSQQQSLQQLHGNHLDTSVLASAVRVAATIGLSVSHSGSGEPVGCDVSPTMSSTNSVDLPYILRSVSTGMCLPHFCPCDCTMSPSTGMCLPHFCPCDSTMSPSTGMCLPHSCPIVHVIVPCHPVLACVCHISVHVILPCHPVLACVCHIHVQLSM